jgi:hypothetical protein
MRLIVSIGLLLPLWAADAPRISDAQRARFWRAQAEVIAAQGRLDKAVAAFQGIEADLIKACGDQQLVRNSDGEPGCAPKPPERPKDTK